MIRQEKTIKISDKEITVYELNPEQLIDALPLWFGLVDVLAQSGPADGNINLLSQGSGKGLASFVAVNKQTFLRVLDSATSEGKEIRGFGGSAFMDVFDAFMEVNKGFFTKAGEQKGKAAGPQKKQSKKP